MKDFLEQAQPILDKIDLTITIALDGGIVTMSIVPKPKKADDAFTAPPLNLTGPVENFGQAGIARIVSVLSKSVPSLMNHIAFEDQIKAIEKTSKDKLDSKKSPKPAAKKKDEPAGLFATTTDEGNDGSDDGEEGESND